ncbi:MAG: cation-translocating P-type ATPase [Oscillospiraceae bacterium]|nr:cation-translocating P-type ATPase [Oscillospiraceae bacterium]
MNHVKDSIEDLCRHFGTDPGKGLTDEAAAVIRDSKGVNAFEEERRETVLQKAVHHLKDFTSLILLAAGLIALYLAISDPEHSFTDTIVIFTIIVVNLGLAIKQEMGAEKALEALRKMSAPMTVALRGGLRQTIGASELVPGDVITLEAGNMVPADARIIESSGLKADEAILTGESVPAEKSADAVIGDNAPLGDRLNMLFSGCLITNGKAKALVVETGMSTEMGKIAGLLNAVTKERTPLQQKMNALGKIICFVALGSAAALFLLQVFDASIALPEILLNAVSMAVAVIPECLPIIITITLAYGVLMMARKNAIIRKIPAVETLGSASVVCSDKTGTLTMNRMTITRVWAVGHEPIEAHLRLRHDEMRTVELMGLASNASITTVDGVEAEIGDPTETAIVRLLKDKHIEKESLDTLYPKVYEIPFDSDRKLMTTVHKSNDLESLRFISITKGAFERIPIDATSVCSETARRVHDEFAGQALRVLAVAYKYYDRLPEVMDVAELEHGLTFAGFVGMIDPPRPESKEAVRTAKEAGIKTVMITGDHVITASAIAKEIGILSEGEKVVSGVELTAMSDGELAAGISDYSVYARVSPEDKIRIVKAWQSKGAVVAMTGDGVNDAPALKAADVGVAMGSGTDVAKSASDVILTDDNFSSIVHAVAEGRRVYDNIRKVLYSLIACNISEIFTMLLIILFWQKAPLVAIQLLLINVIADGIPDLCLCREPMEKDIMRRGPIDKNASVFAGGLGMRIAVVAAVFAVASIVGYYIGSFVSLHPDFPPSHELGVTMAYVAVGWTSVMNILNVRSFKQSIFKIGLTTNRLLFFGVCFSTALIIGTAMLPPSITNHHGLLVNIFHCVPLSAYHWLILIGLAISPVVVVESQKAFIRGRERARMG